MATYTVQSGDTLSAIAEANGITLAEVIRLNPQIANPDLIHPGDEITISEDVIAAAIEEAPAAEAPAASEEMPAEPAAVPEALTEAVNDAAAAATEAKEQQMEGRLAI
ncbi:MAG: LysM domain-containing protein [Dehalococcoidia bacterium]